MSPSSDIRLPRRQPCLIVEGGGMRGFFAAGILAELLDAGVYLPCAIGVSSGALCAAAYASGLVEPDFSALGDSPAGFVQPVGFVRPRRGIVRTDALIDSLTGGVWERLFARDRSVDTRARLEVCATDALTARTVWWSDEDFAASPDALRSRLAASASIPFVMPEAEVDGRVFADGGILDSIPLDHAVELGYERHVMVLTRPRGYVKPRQHLELYLHHVLRPYPALKRAMLERHIRYNAAARAAEKAEDERRAFVFRLDRVELGRFEYNPRKLRRTFDEGRAYADSRMDGLQEWLASAR